MDSNGACDECQDKSALISALMTVKDARDALEQAEKSALEIWKQMYPDDEEIMVGDVVFLRDEDEDSESVWYVEHVRLV